MSVILYENEKFLELASSLKAYGKELAHLFNYPDGWDTGGMDPIIDAFVQRLAEANTEAWNERYEDENRERERLFFYFQNPIGIYDLIKSLKSVGYNMVESVSFEETKRNLFNVIYFLMSRVIDEIPEYKNSEAWG